MFVKEFEKEKTIYESELEDTLQNICKETPFLNEMKYFVNVVNDYFRMEKMSSHKPKIIVLGTSIPEEVIYAAGAVPFWILGGSLGTASWADDMVPRDTDPVSKSILGYLLNDQSNLAEDAMIIIPVSCDSNRKLAYMLRRSGRKVHTVDFPPVKDDAASLEKWNQQLERCCEAVSAHTGKRITKSSLSRATNKIAYTRNLMQQFVHLATEKSELFSGAFRMFILYSYYCTSDITQWCQHLLRLNNEIKKYPASTVSQTKSNVLLMGSPIYFPNYKIPFLIQDVGLNISLHMDYTANKIYTDNSNEKDISGTFKQMTSMFYLKDSSSSYINNNVLFNNVSQMIGKVPIDGVVYHVLKGQIEYDFELEQFEELFAEYGIPVFRLETDYKYQDVEQLRIRMEAFMEMLLQKKYQKEDLTNAL